jgi:serine/threonine-protein phosphatase 2A activator
MFGASQLSKHESYVPESIHSEKALIDSDDYMYFGCIKFIKSVKKGVAFGEGSPMLNDISGVPTWEKVTLGLMKMF